MCFKHEDVFAFPEPTEFLFTLEEPTKVGYKIGSLNIVDIPDALKALEKIPPEGLLLTKSHQSGYKTLAFTIQ
ncbi:hypothetical protein WA026_015103 [Henosepilachna vigintioctopunctata]|uniref:Uncharacterized protein n=1 Tax=Henosepilachna vigintioctopunctata TaxID=420089 RepID=A0AAW1TKM2_9CUCU